MLGNPSDGEVRKAPSGYDVARVRGEFPILERQIEGAPIAYLDNAASTQKPRSVIEAVSGYYCRHNANVHRGVHRLSLEATEAFEGAREKVRRFIGARSTKEVIFVRGATEGINLVAQSFARPRLSPGDEVLVSMMEHHSNIVPWQLVCEEKGARVRVVPITDAGEILLEDVRSNLGPKTKILALSHVSNALGTINPVREIVRIAHERDVPVLLDSAQALAHERVDVQQIDCDFLVLSGHKMYGPTGIGALYGKEEQLESMPPYQGGGDMIRSVSFDGTTFNVLPYRFEAGTPNIAGAVGLGAAVDFLAAEGIENIAAHEKDVLDYGREALLGIPGLRLIGDAPHKASVLSFVVEGIHPHDLGTIVDQHGVAIRTGHHCAQPTMERFGVPATARASIGCYNTRAEIDALIRGIHFALEVMSR